MGSFGPADMEFSHRYLKIVHCKQNACQPIHCKQNAYSYSFGGRNVDEGDADAPAMLMVHGMPISSYLYRQLIKRFVAEGYRCVAPKHIGFGKKGKAQLVTADMAGYYPMK